MSIGQRTFYPNEQAKSMIADILDTGRVSYGKYSKELERRFAAMHGCQYGVLSNSGTSSLQVALQALKELHGWPDGSEVIVPALTFVATINVVLHNRLTPVLVDVDPSTYNMSPEAVGDLGWERKERVAAIPVHLFGQPAEMSRLIGYAMPSRMAVIEDSCEAVLARHKPKSSVLTQGVVGSIGDVGCFSFYMAHHVQAGVGGIATTNHPDLAHRMRSITNHGLDISELGPDDEYDPMMLGRIFSFTSVGHSYRITEFEAALALSQLDSLQHSVMCRQEAATILANGLSGLEDRLQLPYVAPGNTHSFMVFPLTCKQEGHRDSLRAFLQERGIGTRLMLPLTNQPVYRTLFREADYPVAAYANRNGFYLGLSSNMAKEELETIADAIHTYYLNS